ncbi:MAG: heavy-metal-associated domain-containing protein [Bacteroidetes bacterium]|nr:heavy-metal-associated domain-containing protein [Bacteroidota bacterium]MCH9029226.1 heavy-metal-associated domain-containing protein [Bacteroidota bacterium]
MKQLLILSTLIVFGLTAIISAQSETKSDKIKVETKVETKTYSVKGMTCQGCVSSVETKLGKINGVQKYEVDLEKGEAVVEFDPEKVKSDDIEKEFEGTSFKVSVKETETETNEQEE